MKPLTPKTCGAIIYGHNCGQQLLSSWDVGKQL
jgi:hypothetical protein